jgi:hypothetical protein
MGVGNLASSKVRSWLPGTEEAEELGRLALSAARKTAAGRRRDGWPEGTDGDDVIQEVAILTFRRLIRWSPRGGRRRQEHAARVARKAMIEIENRLAAMRRRSSDALDAPGRVPIERALAVSEKAA